MPNGEDTFMTIREMLHEVREDVKNLEASVDRLHETTVHRQEFEAYLKDQVSQKRWLVGTAIALGTTTLGLIGLILQFFF